MLIHLQPLNYILIYLKVLNYIKSKYHKIIIFKYLIMSHDKNFKRILKIITGCGRNTAHFIVCH